MTILTTSRKADGIEKKKSQEKNRKRNERRDRKEVSPFLLVGTIIGREIVDLHSKRKGLDRWGERNRFVRKRSERHMKNERDPRGQEREGGDGLLMTETTEAQRRGKSTNTVGAIIDRRQLVAIILAISRQRFSYRLLSPGRRYRKPNNNKTENGWVVVDQLAREPACYRV